jgi:SAM-dependent methyltransferase
MSQPSPPEPSSMSLRPSRLLGRFGLRIIRLPAVKRWAWRLLYEVLARRVRIPEWRFMNFGYAELDGGRPIELEERDEIERHALQMYAQVAAAASLAGRDVLEVGSGRGGGAAWLHRACGCASVTGIDIAPTAVAIANGSSAPPALRFLEGDAQRLAFEDASFDVVLSVESSHAYARPDRFLAGGATGPATRRGAGPGGHPPSHCGVDLGGAARGLRPPTAFDPRHHRAGDLRHRARRRAEAQTGRWPRSTSARGAVHGVRGRTRKRDPRAPAERRERLPHLACRAREILGWAGRRAPGIGRRA